MAFHALPALARDAALDGMCGASRDELLGGKLALREQTPEGPRGVALRVCGTVDAPPAAVWEVLRDCGKFEEFLPGVAHSRLTQREAGVAYCDETIDLPFPLRDLESLSRVREEPLAGGGFARRWEVVRGTYRRRRGAWLIYPLDQAAARSLVVYEVDMEPETMIPDFLIRYAQSTAAPEVFRAVRERVQQCRALACGAQ